MQTKIPHYFKHPTPRERIRFLRKQIISLDNRFNMTINPPSLCSFCRHFWFDQGLEDCDYGCYVEGSKLDTCNEDIPDIMKCRYFRENKNWKLEAEGILNDALWKGVSKVAPFTKKLDQIRAEIAALEVYKKKLISDIETEINSKKQELEKLLPAEILAKIANAWDPKKE